MVAGLRTLVQRIRFSFLKNFWMNLVGKKELISITPRIKEDLSLKKQLPIKNNPVKMNKVESLKKRVFQRLGLNLIAYMGNPDCNKDWLDGYEQAKKDVTEAIHQIEIYMPYLDED